MIMNLLKIFKHFNKGHERDLIKNWLNKLGELCKIMVIAMLVDIYHIITARKKGIHAKGMLNNPDL